MKELLQRYWISLWWILSVGLTLLIGYLARLVVRESPFTDWDYIVGMAVAIPTALLPMFLYMLRHGSGTKL